MASKIRRMLHSQKGFTLIELMTVLIILGVVLGIGVPKYLKIQEKAEYDADKTTIENIAKAAEVYAAQINDYNDVAINGVLITKGIIDGGIVLNRTKDAAGKSIKNTAKTTLANMIPEGDLSFKFTSESGDTIGEITNLDTIITTLIGTDPYGTP